MIDKRKMGTLKIYIEPSHKMKNPDSFFRRIFPKSAYLHLISEAKKDGIMNASVYQTHSGFSVTGKIQPYRLEGDNANLSLCLEITDTPEKLETFFLKHHHIISDKIVIYSEAEAWSSAASKL